MGGGKNDVAPGFNTGVVGMKKNPLPEGDNGVNPGKCILLDMLGLGRRYGSGELRPSGPLGIYEVVAAVLVVVSGFNRLFIVKEKDCAFDEPNGEVSAG